MKKTKHKFKLKPGDNIVRVSPPKEPKQTKSVSLAALLEEACMVIEKLDERLMEEGEYQHAQLSPELDQWWAHRKTGQNKRLQKIRKQALVKLSAIEKKALGL